ncbi:DUF5074 domain-containing protein [Mangrovimonas futianensis]|uniref:DUF5074 domain-containing protein n=1 Tax=Mangrovimonas futianensis TaxID=2895523 RepID=UPI001E55178D|nr:DUF5074 domain-containing protein [Mangrovimonas futianensis]MCF1422402.1 cell surface protein [Mangrovimonas futianensis]
MKNYFKSIMLLLSLGLFVFSCSDDDNITPIENPSGTYENGMLVLAEGGSISGSVSYISSDFTEVENNIFFNINSDELGTYVQSMAFLGGKGYIVTDNNTINVVDRYSFEREATITNGLSLPRYMAVSNGKGYVTNWGDGFVADDDFVAVIDLSSNTVQESIPVGEGPEQILAIGDKLFVSHKGGYSTNNIISVINTTDNSIETIEVADNPDEMFVNGSGQLVVLSEGATIYDANWTPIGDTPGAITTIDPSNNSVVSEIAFAEGFHPNLMAYSQGYIYYQLNNQVFEMSEASTSLPTSAIINLSGTTPYGLNVNGTHLFVTDAKDFASLSDLLVFDLTDNSLANTIEVGLIASKVYFN